MASRCIVSPGSKGRKNHGDETTAALFASVHGATLAGRVGQWSDRVARQSAACCQWGSALLSRLADTDCVSAGTAVGSSITPPVGLSAVVNERGGLLGKVQVAPLD